MLRSRKEVLGFLGRTLLALPVALAIWYFTAPLFDDIAARIAAPVIGITSGGKITEESYRKRQIHYQVTIHAPYRMGARTQPPAIVDLQVNGSIYTVGLALFLALSAALKPSRHAGRIVIGCVVLLVVPAWGVAFDTLKQLGATAALGGYLEWSSTTREVIALGYQLGALLLPTIVPIALWLGLSPEILRETPATPPAA